MSAVSEWLYALRQALRMIAQQPGRFYLSVIIAGAALALPLLVVALTLAALPPLKAARLGPEISVFVKIGTAPRDVEALRVRLATVSDVTEVRLIPRDQAFADLSKRSGLAAGAGDGRSNPLPDTLVARFGFTVEPAAIDRTAAEVRQWPGVDAVVSEIGWYRRLSALRQVGLAVAVGVTGLVALLIVTALIGAAQMTIQLRPDETRLLQLIGARPRFVRRPYAYVGALTLATGAALAIGIAWITLELLGRREGALASVLSTASVPPWFPLTLVLGASLLGGAVGAMGAWLQMKRFQPW
jgi:cell division transport system permease protein